MYSDSSCDIITSIMILDLYRTHGEKKPTITNGVSHFGLDFE